MKIPKEVRLSHAEKKETAEKWGNENPGIGGINYVEWLIGQKWGDYLKRLTNKEVNDE